MARLMKRVRRYQVPAEGVFSGVVGFTDVAVRTPRGTFNIRIEAAPGSPGWPLSEEARKAKFLDCAARALGQSGAKALLETVWRTAALADISAIAETATPSGETGIHPSPLQTRSAV